MNILLCERNLAVPEGDTVYALRDRIKPNADILVLNGAPVSADVPLSEGDSVNLIRRGEVPPAEELEALLVARHTPGVHRAIRTASVGIAGLGGLGSTIAIALVRCGVGKLVLADFDVVEPSNLNRQQYSIDQIGQYKADALTANLHRINPYVEIEPHIVRLDEDNIGKVFEGVSVMLEAFDTVEAKAMIVNAFPRIHPDVPLIVASGLAGYGPGNRIRTRNVVRNIYLVGDEESAARPGMGLMAPRVGIAASHQANAALRLLLGLDPVEDADA
jgi:sulfur carrier protein ThiS adenylyltransferase